VKVFTPGFTRRKKKMVQQKKKERQTETRYYGNDGNRSSRGGRLETKKKKRIGTAVWKAPNGRRSQGWHVLFLKRENRRHTPRRRDKRDVGLHHPGKRKSSGQ